MNDNLYKIGQCLHQIADILMGRDLLPTSPLEVPNIDDKDWPKILVDGDEQTRRKERAEKISNRCGFLTGRVLLCTVDNQPELVNLIRSKPNVTDVFNIKPSDVFPRNQFDSVLIYDYIDHIPQRLHSEFISNVIDCTKKGCKIEILIHPWISVDGGHDKKLRHFSHLVHDESSEVFCARIIDPIPYYQKLFDGYEIDNYHYDGRDPDPWVLTNILPVIASKIYGSNRKIEEVAHLISIRWIRYRIIA